MRILLFSVLIAFTLTGCRTIWDPTPMPSGYRHQNQDYHSAPGPENWEYIEKDTSFDKEHRTVPIIYND